MSHTCHLGCGMHCMPTAYYIIHLYSCPRRVAYHERCPRCHQHFYLESALTDHLEQHSSWDETAHAWRCDKAVGGHLDDGPVLVSDALLRQLARENADMLNRGVSEEQRRKQLGDRIAVALYGAICGYT